MDIKKLLGKKVSSIRKSKGMSQIRFAEILDISVNALSLIETGNGFLTAETLEKILKAFNMTPEELFTLDIQKTETQIYSDIIRLLDTVKSDRHKLSVIYSILKNIV